MKRLISLLLVLLVICTAFVGCKQEKTLRTVQLNEVTRSVF